MQNSSINAEGPINANVDVPDPSEPEIQIEQSRISKTLTEQTMQAIVLVILGLLFLLPLFQANTYQGDNRANYEMLQIAANLYKAGSWDGYVLAINSLIQRTQED